MRLAVVTGASSGIGAAAARRLAAEGYTVALVARTESRLRAIAAGIGPNAIVLPCDAGDPAAALAAADRVRREYGTPDLIVNAAGAGRYERVEDTSPAEAEDMMRAPYLAAFHFTHAFMPDLLARGRGVVVHVGSPATICPWPASVGYCAARWALKGFHEALCFDLAGTGVWSCHVVFGKVSSGYFEHNPGTEGKIPRLAKLIPTVTPDDCAGVIARVVRRPRREVFYPFMLRLFAWNHMLAPGLVRWMVRKTAPVAERTARPATPSRADTPDN